MSIGARVVGAAWSYQTHALERMTAFTFLPGFGHQDVERGQTFEVKVNHLAPETWQAAYEARMDQLRIRLHALGWEPVAWGMVDAGDRYWPLLAVLMRRVRP